MARIRHLNWLIWELHFRFTRLNRRTVSSWPQILYSIHWILFLPLIRSKCARLLPFNRQVHRPYNRPVDASNNEVHSRKNCFQILLKACFDVQTRRMQVPLHDSSLAHSVDANEKMENKTNLIRCNCLDLNENRIKYIKLNCARIVEQLVQPGRMPFR